MSDPNIRYNRLSDILDLVFLMAKEPLGVTISDIEIRYCVSRRTAERMRDSILNVLPQVDIIETEDTHKHWGFINFSISNIFVNSNIEKEGV